MIVLLMPNKRKDNSYICSLEVITKLNSLGMEILMEENFEDFLGDIVKDKNVKFGILEAWLEKCDVIITIGGDGTIIQASKYAVKYNKPILGINAGRLGFLAEVEQNELDDLDLLANGKFKVESRMMISAKIISGDVVSEYVALNDMVISKGALSKVIDLDVYCMDKFVSSYRADGIIISTPTGSTAYSMSAGGPIIEPTIDLIVLTPISPHSLFDRSIVFSPDNVLEIKITGKKETPVYLTVDGKEVVQINLNDAIVLSKSEIQVKIINLKNKLFYEVLNEKFVTRAKE